MINIINEWRKNSVCKKTKFSLIKGETVRVLQ